MAVTNDAKFTWNNVGSRNFKNTSVSSNSTVTSKAAAATGCDVKTGQLNRLESLADEEFIQKNLKELMDKKHQEERKANGRLVAVILASLVIFLTIYHAWIRNSSMLTGVLVPAVIMLSFAAWVVVLAKRDKAKRQIYEKYLQEMALKNRQELKAKAKLKSKKSKQKKSSNNILIHYENEINNEQIPLTYLSANSSETKTTSILKSKDHRKHRKRRNPTNSDGYSTTSSSSSSKKSSHYATKDLRVKRPSIRQKLFRQTGIFYQMPVSSANATHTLVQAVINTPVPQGMPPLVNELTIQSSIPLTLLESKRKRLQRIDALQVPTMVRMSSAP